MSNVTNPHTFTLCGSVDLILATVLLAHGHLLQLDYDVVSGATVHIPVYVDAIGAICCGSHLLICGL